MSPLVISEALLRERNGPAESGWRRLLVIWLAAQFRRVQTRPLDKHVHPWVPRRHRRSDGRDIRHPYTMESLSALFRRSLLNVSKASNLPTVQDETQVRSHFRKTVFLFELSCLGFNRRGTEGLSQHAHTRSTSCALQSQRDPRRYLYSRSGIFICSICSRRDRK